MKKQLIAIACCLLLAASALAERPPIVAAYALSSRVPTDANPYGLSDKINQPGGWMKLAHEIAESPVDVILLHRPFGEATAKNKMDMNSRVLLLRDRAWSWVIYEADAAIEWLAEHAPDKTLIVYVGTVTPVMDASREAGEFASLSYNLLYSIGPAALNARNVDLAFDQSSGGLSYTSDVYRRWLDYLRAIKREQGRLVWCEALAFREGWNADYPTIIASDHWRRMAGTVELAKRVADAEPGRPIIRWLVGEQLATPEAINNEIDDCAAWGHWPAIHPRYMEQLDR